MTATSDEGITSLNQLDTSKKHPEALVRHQSKSGFWRGLLTHSCKS